MMKVNINHLSSALKRALIVSATLLLLSVTAGRAAMAIVIEPQASSQGADQAKLYGHVYRIGKEVSTPVATHYEEAEFPTPKFGPDSEDNLDRLGGTCEIALIVDASGKPHEVQVRRSLRPDFDANAIKAVQQYRFKPAERLGKPVAVSMTIRVIFKKD